jgi:hypothetical protein
MAVMTTVVAPPLIQAAYRDLVKPPEPEEEIFRLG